MTMGTRATHGREKKLRTRGQLRWCAHARLQRTMCEGEHNTACINAPNERATKCKKWDKTQAGHHNFARSCRIVNVVHLAWRWNARRDPAEAACWAEVASEQGPHRENGRHAVTAYHAFEKQQPKSALHKTSYNKRGAKKQRKQQTEKQERGRAGRRE